MLRTPGFVPTGGDGLSMNQALLATVGLIGAYLYFPKSRYLFLLVGMLLISMLSTAFAGRSGLYLGVLFAIIIIATRKSNFQITRNFQWIIIISIVLAIPVVLFAQQIGVYGYNLVGKFGYEYPVVRLLRGFIDMQATGTYSDRTIETLLGRMVVLPEEPLRFLIGNNAFGRQEATHVHTDVGYFRMWHGFGLIGLIVFLFGVYFLPVLYLFRLRLMTIRVIYNKRLKDMIIVRFQMVFFVLVFGLIGHYKIFFISTRIYLFVFFVLLFLVCNQYQVLRTQMMSGVQAHEKK